MKKKNYIYLSVLLVFLFSLSGCKNNDPSGNVQDFNTSPAPEETAITDMTAKPQEDRLEETEAPASDLEYNGKIYKNNKGLQLEYDSSVFEVKEEDNMIKILPNDTDTEAQENLNVLISIILMEDITAKDMEKELTKNDIEVYDTSAVTIGVNHDKATKISVKNKSTEGNSPDNHDTLHEYYLVEQSGILWLVELKCPWKYQKKYQEKMDKILNMLSFEK